jgi:hypothetical protein
MSFGGCGIAGNVCTVDRAKTSFEKWEELGVVCDIRRDMIIFVW